MDMNISGTQVGVRIVSQRVSELQAHAHGTPARWQHDIRQHWNADVVIDFRKAPQSDGREEKPEYVQHVIETLIPEVEGDEDAPMLLEVWGNPDLRWERRGWRRIVVEGKGQGKGAPSARARAALQRILMDG